MNRAVESRSSDTVSQWDMMCGKQWKVDAEIQTFNSEWPEVFMDRGVYLHPSHFNLLPVVKSGNVKHCDNT